MSAFLSRAALSFFTLAIRRAAIADWTILYLHERTKKNKKDHFTQLDGDLKPGGGGHTRFLAHWLVGWLVGWYGGLTRDSGIHKS